MFFTCPNCGTVYDVPADKVAPASKFRCAKCGHVWKTAYSVPEERVEFKNPPEKKREQPPAAPKREDPLDAAANDFENPAFTISEPEGIDDGPDLSVFTPIFKKPDEKPFYFQWLIPLYVTGIVCVFITLYTFFFHEARLPDLVFESLSPEFIEKDQREDLYLKAVLKNNTTDPLIVSAFKVTFIDGHEKVIMNQDFSVSDLKLEAGEVKAYSLFIGRPPAKTLRMNAEVTRIIR